MSHTADFLEKTVISSHHQRRKGFFRFGILVIIGLLLVYIIIALLGAGRLLASALNAQNNLEQAKISAEELDFAETQNFITEAEKNIQKAQQGLFVLKPIKVVPWIGDQVRGVEEVLKASIRLLLAFEDATVIAENVVTVVDQAKQLGAIPFDQSLTYLTLPKEVRHDILERLHQSLPEFERMKARLTLAEEDLQKLDALDLFYPLAKAIEPFRSVIPELRTAIDLLIPFSAVLPELAGLDDSSSFLLLFENNTELRPGGGFIGTIGSLNIEDGFLERVLTEDVYTLDAPVEGKMKTIPPSAYPLYLGVNAWYLRDANWSPDFSVSAKKALELYAEEQALQALPKTDFDGVIALTPTFAGGLLRVVGPVSIDGQVFTAEEIAEQLDYAVGMGFASSGLPREQRKEIVGTLVDEVLNRLFALPLSKWGSVVTEIQKAFDEKQLLIYSTDTNTQTAIEKARWGAVLRPDETFDTLMVVDANMASLKTDPAVARSVSYRIRQNEEGKLVAQASVTYKHNGTFDWKTTRYRTFTRFYVPKGSEIIRSEGFLVDDMLKNPTQIGARADQYDESGYTVFAGFTSIEPGDECTISVSYFLPDRLADSLQAGQYALDLLKQPGAENNKLTVDIDFGTPVQSALPSEDATEFGDTKYLLNTIIDQDKEITIRY